MYRGIIKILIDNPLRLAGPPTFTGLHRWNQIVEKLGKYSAVMGQLVGNKQRLAFKAAYQIFKQPPSIVQFARVMSGVVNNETIILERPPTSRR